MKQRIISIALLVVTSACTVGPAIRIPVELPGGKKATIVVHPKTVPNWLLRNDGSQLNYVVRGDLTQEDLNTVAAVENACRIYTDEVTPNLLVAVVSSGTLYALAGFLGVGAGSQALAGSASFLQYGAYGAAAGGLGGAANAVITTRGGRVYTYQNCGREVLDLFKNNIQVLHESPW